jgi:hypothetical protein
MILIIIFFSGNSDLFHKVVADERAATEAVSRRQ